MFKIKWLAQVFPNFKIKKNHSQTEIKTVTTDSRILEENSLFIPLVGDNFDGHEYAKQAIKNGAKVLVWDNRRSLGTIPEDIAVFFVEDTLKALQLLAKEYRKLVNPMVIGITGSNGKTTTKDLLKATLNKTYITKATEGNFNNHVGLPLTILKMKKDTEVLILEMGMNDFGEIDLLSYIATPDVAIITNIGESHIEYLGSREGISQAKLEVVKHMKQEGILIIDGDEPLLKESDFNGEMITCGFSSFNQYVISDITLTRNMTTFLVNKELYKIPLLGRHHAQNATFVIVASKKLGLNYETIQAGLNQTKTTGMRFELLNGKNGTTLINDAYNASPTSMKASIEVVDELEGYKEKVLVLGDMLELGLDFEKFYQEVSEKIIETKIKKVYTYGEFAQLITNYLKKNSIIEAVHFNVKTDLIKELKNSLVVNNLIFFKASRGIKLEDVIEKLK